MTSNVSDLLPEQMDELVATFETLDSNGNGVIEFEELQTALEICGFKMARYQVRDLAEKYDVKQRDGMIDFEEFRALYRELRQSDFGSNLHRMVKSRSDLMTHGSKTGSNDVKHSVRLEEQVAFADWLNKNLAADEDCQRYLPFEEDGSDLYKKCDDGIILCKVINIASPDTIDERVLNKGENLSLFKRNENITLALNSAQSLGCVVVSMGASEVVAGTQHLILGLLWQIIKVGLLADVNLAANSELRALFGTSEASIEDIRSLAPEQLLMKWVNYHLERAGSKRRIANFSDDIKDSEAYAYLLQQIIPKESGNGMHSASDILQQREHQTRAELVLQNAELVDARVFVQPSDIVAGNSNLNLAFVANLFHKFPSLPEPGEDGAEDGAGGVGAGGVGAGPIGADENHAGFGADAFLIDETREEKTYRNWMNSMGVAPRVNYLYTDLRSGLTLFHLYDLIRPGIVRWPRVHKTFHRMRENFERLENCNYAVELGRQVGFSLVGIGGEDLLEGNVTLTLALVWQLMRAYTLAILSKLAGSAAAGKRIDERAIIAWANQRLERGGKSGRLASFQDLAIADARLVLDLIDCLRPGSVNYANVLEGTTEAERLQNAKLAINLGWRAGAKIYALPEDIVEVKPKMVMTIFACLMQLDFESPATVKLAASPVSTTSNSSAGGDSLGSGSASQQ
ncbi:hypothetical protein BOX15_Mlig009179g2 [Macrostomum lignano]|uniref:Plastin-3 n=1 Tax=Macrostomum lignano TaxID=282301 RepID=A0A267ER08_9PLAT|nr:hypothetical protein BOX15_Mlig009179g2 [Macrostomum lignano]